MKITEISIKRPSIILVLFIILTFLGLSSYNKLSYELLPKFSSPIVTVQALYPGASPNEVENTVTKKLEDAVSSMENVDKITATSYEGLSVVVVQLRTEANVDLALQDAQRKVNAILAELPEDVKSPSLGKFSIDDLPIMRMGVSASMNATELYDLVEQRIQPNLAKIPGVAQTNLIGGEEREIRVNVDNDKLQAYRLSLPQLVNLIESSNLDFPTGKIKTQEEQVLIRLAGKYANLDDLRNLVVAYAPNGGPVRLSDVAEVQDTKKETELVNRIDLQNSIGISIQKQSDANAVSVSELVRKELLRLEQIYGKENLKFTIAQDSSEYTLDAADAVIHDLILAVVLVAAIMLLFLHSLRNSVIVMIAIPLSLIATFIGMSLFGFTLNLMSLLGLSLVVGILVDDAIVVIENIYRHMEMGKSKVQAAYDGVKEIGFTVVSITLVIVVVFLPIALTTGLISNIMRQFSLVVVIATLLSLLVSFTMVPYLYSRFGKLEHISAKNFFGRIILGFEKALDRFTVWIQGILKWALAHRAVTIIGAVALFFASIALVGGGFIGSEFVSQGDRGEFILVLEYPKKTSVEQNNIMTKQIEEFVSSKPEVTSLFTSIGQTSESGMGSSQATAYKSEINVKLVPEDQRQESSAIYGALLKNEILQKFPGVKVKATPISILGSAEQAPIQLIVTGPTYDTVMQFANKLMDRVKKVEGTQEVKLSVESGSPEVVVTTDRRKMAELGLDLQNVGATMQYAFSGNTDAKFRQGEYEYDINVRFDEYDRRSVDDIKSITFLNKFGQTVRLDQFAEVKESSGPSRLERYNRITSVNVNSQLLGRSSGAVAAEIKTILDTMDKPSGVAVTFGGNQENQEESFASLGFAFMTSILLVYLIMVALYNNFIYPFVVLFSIPLAMIGALWALALTANTLSIFTILGIIMLIGLVAKNAILVVDFTNHLKEKGMPTNEALLEATKERLRPVLMTTIAMVVGMLPVALATGAGAAWKNGLAWSIIGGLISSTFLTLVVVPVVYQLVDRLMEKTGLVNKEKEVQYTQFEV
ncbi:efflux RND transporter permease subunit [Chryseosolibacter indicus]|uniref:Efflux RND transporter permease subunit n=1 Tax=Chryseosolibacter indicus TaxID=2782351 RepID=A0ABS5VWL7_9BACT|nr:efflux RND transporter permease subunit [Chryseosolibacter indicus]MBT1705726.1 efflux RND transporter permease subunit [Chryseosolibacter indicus]